eukprot:scaffold4361_cov341-Prasinococcus_capsulatus_cf.AAC.4
MLVMRAPRRRCCDDDRQDYSVLTETALLDAVSLRARSAATAFVEGTLSHCGITWRPRLCPALEPRVAFPGVMALPPAPARGALLVAAARRWPVGRRPRQDAGGTIGGARSAVQPSEPRRGILTAKTFAAPPATGVRAAGRKPVPAPQHARAARREMDGV